MIWLFVKKFQCGNSSTFAKSVSIYSQKEKHLSRMKKFMPWWKPHIMTSVWHQQSNNRSDIKFWWFSLTSRITRGWFYLPSLKSRTKNQNYKTLYVYVVILFLNHQQKRSMLSHTCAVVNFFQSFNFPLKLYEKKKETHTSQHVYSRSITFRLWSSADSMVSVINVNLEVLRILLNWKKCTTVE